MSKKTKKRIGIDARFYGPVGKGLGRYTQEVVDNLLKIDSENEYVVFLGRENFNAFQAENPRVKKVLAKVRWYTLSEQVLMPYYIWKEKIDLMHFHHFNVPILCPTKFVVTIHDLILIKFPSLRATKLSPFLYKIKNSAYKLVLKFAVKKSEKIIAVSEFTKNDILENFKISPDKVIVTYEGVSEKLKNEKVPQENILDSLGVKKPYLLYVGNAYPHKNLEWLIESFFDFRNDFLNYQLVLVGKEDYFYKRLKDSLGSYSDEDFSERVIFPGYVPDEQLVTFFKNAKAYVFPSKYEGFGIPPLEAMANDCPVLSSNAASMPEILGEAALYFDPESKEQLRSVFNNLKDEETINNLKEKGRAQVERYSWQNCARETKEVLLSGL